MFLIKIIYIIYKNYLKFCENFRKIIIIFIFNSGLQIQNP